MVSQYIDIVYGKIIYRTHCLGENNNNPAKSFFLFGFQFQTINVVFHNSKEKDMIQRKDLFGFIERFSGDEKFKPNFS